MMNKIILSVVFLFAVASNFINAQSVTFDSTFNSNGIVINALGTINDEIRAITLQPDGKIIAAGLSYSANPSMLCAMARYLPNGLLDTTFSIDGKFIDSYGQLSCNFNAVALQTDGKIIAAGFARDSITFKDNIGIARYNQDGSIDSTFGIAGKVMTDYFGDHDNVRGLVIQQDGKIVTAGSTVDSLHKNIMSIERYNSDGTLDTTFNNDGKFSFYFGLGASCTSLAMQPDGKFIMSGITSITNNLNNIAVVRINTDGILDSTFGVNGKQTIATSYSIVLESVALQTDGKIVASGYAITNPPYYEFATVRLLPNGMPDSTFGTNAIIVDTLGPYIDYSRAVTIQQDGKIIVAGASASTGLQNDFTLVRYTADGVRDSTFGVNGKLVNIISPGYETIYALQLQPDGKLIAAGFAEMAGQRQFALVRYTSDLATGIIDVATSSNSISVYPNPFFNEINLNMENVTEKNVSIELFDVTGKLVFSWDKIAVQNQVTLKPISITSGIYLLTVKAGKKVYKSLVIKQ